MFKRKGVGREGRNGPFKFCPLSFFIHNIFNMTVCNSLKSALGTKHCVKRKCKTSRFLLQDIYIYVCYHLVKNAQWMKMSKN